MSSKVSKDPRPYGPQPARPEISVVIPVFYGGPATRDLVREFAAQLVRLERSYEVVLVLNGVGSSEVEALEALENEVSVLRFISLKRAFEESTALGVGLEEAQGEILLVCSENTDVELGELGRLLAPVDGSVDLAVATRHSRRDLWPNRVQSALFHFLVRRLTLTPFVDITSGLRAMRRKVVDSLDLYGDLYNFLPILAYRQGFTVEEVPLNHRIRHRGFGLYGPQVYWRRSIDLLSIFFMTRFTERPLRFFGALGLFTAGVGSSILLYLGGYRLLGFGGIAGRPLLLAGLLLLVLGIQSISIGLLGEIIIFTRARHRKPYRVAHGRAPTAVTEPSEQRHESAAG